MFALSNCGPVARRAAMAAAIGLTLACAGGTTGSPTPQRGPLGSPEGFSILFRPNGSHSSDVVAAPIQQVWQLLPEAYRVIGFPGRPASAGGGELFFATPHMEISGPMYPGERTSDYIDCGVSPTTGKRSDEYLVTFVIITRLEPADQGGTRIMTLIDGHARDRTLGGNSVPCHGTGKMEGQIAELVKRGITGGVADPP